ncbi:hypothetical protein ACIBCH_09925 [Amycolatopsis thailandensis]|uniref:hypothetical protein n=1 Tax=Amycolatopsis thailandensis TaxID=589330 RepID=UPI0037B47D1C
MTTTSTYMNDLSRVRVSFTGLDASADVALVERSIDGGLNWVTVRGGETVTVTGGVGKIDDYEFTPGVVNTYRVTARDTAAIQFMTSGGAVTGNNASLNPACAGATQIGDLVLLLATIRNSGAGTPNTPSGWTLLVDLGNAKLFGRYATANGSVAQTVTFTGGVANADTTAQMTTFRNAGIVPVGTPATLTNASAQNIAWPAATPSEAPSVAVVLGWKQDDQSSSPVITGWDSEIGYVSSTAGDDASHVWWTRAKADATQQAAGSWTVSGGAAAVSKSAMVFFGKRPFVNQETTTITPTLQDSTGIQKIWIKNLTRPYANTPITTPVGLLNPEREARVNLIPVVGRSVAVAITDKRLGKQYTIGAKLENDTERDRLDAILSAGEVIYLHIPPGNIRLKSMYAVIGTSSYDDEAGIMWLPLSECAAPASTVVGATVTWADIISTYATWADLIAAKATWGDVLDIVGDPTDIITG